MKIELYKLFSSAFFVIFCIGCSGSNSSPVAKQNISNKLTIMDTNYQKVGYAVTILQIDKRCENSGTWDALFADKIFVNIYEHSSYYVDSAIEFLSDEKFNLHQKTVCVYSMQRVELQDYIRFFEECKNLFNTGKIPELLLNRVISPTFGKKKIVVANYDNVDVKRILESIKDGGKASKEFKVMIEKILSGEYWNNVKKFMDESGESN